MPVEDFYSPPDADAQASTALGTDGAAIVEDQIHAADSFAFPPDVCVRCGEPGDDGKLYEKTLKYTPAWTILLYVGALLLICSGRHGLPRVLAGLVFLGSVAIPIGIRRWLQERIDVTYRLCEPCLKRRTRRVALTWAAVALDIGAIVFGAVTSRGDIIGLSGLVLMGLVLLVARATAPPVVAESCDDDGRVVLSNIAPKCLERLHESNRNTP